MNQPGVVPMTTCGRRDKKAENELKAGENKTENQMKI